MFSNRNLNSKSCPSFSDKSIRKSRSKKSSEFLLFFIIQIIDYKVEDGFVLFYHAILAQELDYRICCFPDRKTK